MSFRNANTPSGILAITPSDTDQVDLVGITVGGAGDVTIVDSLGVTTTITAPAGLTISCRVVQVKDTGTTASAIIGYVA